MYALINLRGTSLVFTLFLISFGAKSQMYVDQAESMGVDALITSFEWGSGISVFDFNQDGLDDITLCTNSNNLIFYENTGTGFQIPEFSILAPGITFQTTWVDYNNDGAMDIFFTSFQGRVYLYENNGNFEFDDVTAEAGLPTTFGFYSGASFGDYDRDGDLDLYVGKYVLADFNPSDSTQYNRLYRNNGDETFTDVTASSGILWQPTLSFQPVWLDYNNDLWPDLFLINDRTPTNRFFKNNGDGTFDDVTSQTNTPFAGHDVMSNSVTDFNHDGFLDIFMTNSGTIPFPRPSLLMKNMGGTTFMEVGALYGVNVFDFCWGALWVDANNDTWDDLYFVTPDNQANYFFLSDQGTFFNPASDSISVSLNYPCYSASRGDFNNDGYSDIGVQSESPNPPYVLMNQGGSNSFIKITLEGVVSNKMAIGSWIKVYEDGSEFVKYTMNAENYYGQSSQHIIFGLGDTSSDLDSLKVYYTSGHVDTYYNLSINEHHYLTEGETYTVDIQAAPKTAFCAGDTIYLDAGNHDSYLWSTSDTIREIAISEPGDYSVVVTNEFGVSAESAITVLEHPIPEISVTIDHVDCHEGNSGSLQLVNLQGVEADSVIWSNGLSGLIIDSLAAGPYSFIFTDINGCTAQGSATIFEPTDLTVIASSEPEILGDDGSISIFAFGGTPPYYILLDGDTVSIEITDLSTGTYTLTIVDSNGCQEVIEVFVDTTLSTETQHNEESLIYPNPVKNNFRISSSNVIQSVHLLDISGKPLGKIKTIDGNYRMGNFPPGIYFLRIVFQNGAEEIQRVQKL